MRHLGSLIAGIVAVPLGWLLLAFGQTSSATAFARVAGTGSYHPHDFVRPVLFLAVAGIAIGLVACLRISPVGPLVAGALFAGSYVALLIAPGRVVDLLNYNVHVMNERADLTRPLTSGASLAIGAALLVAVASAGRWRRWPRPQQDVAPVADGAVPDEPESTLLLDGTITSPSWNPFESASSPAEAGAETTGDLPSGIAGSDLPTRGIPGDPTRGIPGDRARGIPGGLTARAPAADLPTRHEAGDLPVRTPGTWPPDVIPGQADPTEAVAGRTQGVGAAVRQHDESVPARGRSPWDTPLRDTGTQQ